MYIGIWTVCYLAVLSVIDIRKKSLSVGILGAGTIPAIAAVCYKIYFEGAAPEEILFALVPGLLILCLAGLRLGAGVGDGIVLLQVALLLLWENMVKAFCMSMIAIGLFSLVCLLATRGKKGKKEIRIPYLPFLWFGCLGALLTQ